MVLFNFVTNPQNRYTNRWSSTEFIEVDLRTHLRMFGFVSMLKTTAFHSLMQKFMLNKAFVRSEAEIKKEIGIDAQII